MSGIRDCHMFTFTGKDIADAARARAAELGVLICGLTMELDAVKADLSAKILQAVEDRTTDLACAYFPEQETTGWAASSTNTDLGRSMSANEARAYLEGPPQKQDVTFRLPDGDYYPLHRLVHRLGTAKADHAKYVSAANRYESQGKTPFELAVGDVDYFGLDKEIT